MRGRAAVLVDHDVRVLLGDEHVAGPRVELERDLVRHRRGREEDRRFLTEERRDALLQRVDRRVLALLLVADRPPRRSPGACPASAASPCRSGGRSRADATVRPWISRSSNARWPSAVSPPTARARSGSGRRAASPRTRNDDAAEGPARRPSRRTCRSRRSSVVTERESRDGTVKALFRTHDGHPVEAVLMRYRDGRRSICLSSQSGCPLTCTFCATGAMRFGRNLRASEILDQALHFRRREQLNHAVYMGMGEPFLNVDEVLASARLLPDIGITHRRTTISTVGWMPGLTPLRGRRGRADPARTLGARGRSGEALRADAGQRSLPAGGRPRRVPPLRRSTSAEGVRRVRDARGSERLSGGRACARLDARPEGVQGEPHPVQPDGAVRRLVARRRSRRSRPCSIARGSRRRCGSRGAVTSRPRAVSWRRADGARDGIGGAFAATRGASRGTRAPGVPVTDVRAHESRSRLARSRDTTRPRQRSSHRRDRRDARPRRIEVAEKVDARVGLGWAVDRARFELGSADERGMLVEEVAEHRLLRGAHLVEAAHRPSVRRLLQELG